MALNSTSPASDLRCLASAQLPDNDDPARPAKRFFLSARWSPDGTSVLTHTSDHELQTYIVPPDLLSTSHTSPLTLTPYSTSPRRHINIWATCTYPYFRLSDASTTLVAQSLADHPIELRNALQYSHRHAQYPLLGPDGETVLTAHALTFTPSGTHLVAGSLSLIAIYDVHRTGQEPEHYLPTAPYKRSRVSTGAVGMRGLVGALAISPATGVLAAGTLSRSIGLYEDGGRGEAIGHFRLPEGEHEGNGITQVLWSPCGQYLYVAERKSDAMLVYDVRVQWRQLGVLTGGSAGQNDSNQRLEASVYSALDARVQREVLGAAGAGDYANVDTAATDEAANQAATGEQGSEHELWAGTTTGRVARYVAPHHTEGVRAPDQQWALHGDSVVAAALHPTGGGVLMSCAGSRDLQAGAGSGSGSVSSDGESSSSGESSSDSESEDEVAATNKSAELKLWTLN